MKAYILLFFSLLLISTPLYSEEAVVPEVVENVAVEEVKEEMAEQENVELEELQAVPSARDFKQEDWLYQKAGFREAVKMQKEKRNPFLVYFYHSDCQDDCDLVEEKLLASKGFIKQTEGVTLVAVNAEHDKRLSSRYAIEEYPALIVFKSKSSAQRVLLFEEEQPFKPGKVLESLRFFGIVPSEEPAPVVAS